MNSGCTVLAVLADGGDGMNSGVHCRRLMEVMELMELMELFGGYQNLPVLANFFAVGAAVVKIRVHDIKIPTALGVPKKNYYS